MHGCAPEPLLSTGPCLAHQETSLPSASEEGTHVTAQMSLKRQSRSKAITRHVQMSQQVVPQQNSSKIKKESKKEDNVGYTPIKVIDDYDQQKRLMLERNSNVIIMNCLEDSLLTCET